MTRTLPALCRQDQSVLVVIDVQTRLMAAMTEGARSSVIQSTRTLMRAANALNIPTILSEQYPRGLGHTEPTVLESSPDVCERIEKTSFSVRGVKAFDELLAMSGREQIILCGAETHVCVLQSALQLNADGFEVFVAVDAVCSRTEFNRDNALVRMREAGVSLSNVESIVFEWLGDSKHSAFKDVSALIQ